jgi:D-alanyl-lipoteichoic acid acyltransferase DltB (MBOAT superfamily)
MSRPQVDGMTAASVTGKSASETLALERALRFGLVAVQLALLAWAIHRFGIESAGFQRLTLLAFAGFAAHAWLPVRGRLPFFLALSLAGFALVLGVANAAWIVAIGLALIGLCHLPAPWSVRIGLLVAAGAGLAWLRTQPFAAPWSAAVWPILASAFMFRLFVYVYDLRHEKKRGSWLEALSYFFLLPNPSFPLFPVVDYATFRKSHYAVPDHEIYQRGVHWIARGVIQLLLYRAVYYHATLEAGEVQGPFDLLRYLVTNFLLYLRVSGQFHVIVGMLHLFGFHLPETNNNYVLSSSFTDFWRRINIYWKDFMLKVFYYPAFFALRKRGTKPALVGATLFVFVVTWFLHSYQWFWLRGSFPVTWQDVLFWGVLALLVVHGTLREADPAFRKRKPSADPAWQRGLRIARTFLAICVLWSVWTAETPGAWLALWKQGFAWHGLPALPALADWAPIAAVAATFAGGVWAAREIARRTAPALAGAAGPAAAIALLCVLGTATAQARLGAAGEVLRTLGKSHLSEGDAARLERGYYEELIDMDRFNSPLWELYMAKPAQWPVIHETPAGRAVRGWMKVELVPSVSLNYHGAQLSTNRWAMRDRDYPLEKAPGTFRLALLGSSHVMGSGVHDDQTFDALLEQRLAERRPGGFARYEVLNFGVEGYTPPQQIDVLRDRALRFAPDAVLFVAHKIDGRQIRAHLAQAARLGVEFPHPALREIVARAGVGPGDMDGEKKLAAHAEELIALVYGEIAAQARRAGAVPVWLLVPTPKEEASDSATPRLVSLAREAGFVVIDETESAYASVPIEQIRVAEWDYHPNAKGHALLAAAIDTALAERAEEIFRAAAPLPAAPADEPTARSQAP